MTNSVEDVILATLEDVRKNQFDMSGKISQIQTSLDHKVEEKDLTGAIVTQVKTAIEAQAALCNASKTDWLRVLKIGGTSAGIVSAVVGLIIMVM